MATMQDVARRAGVSLSTVSYALSGTRSVSAATRDRVAAAMAELGYTPNAMARGLASRRSRVLALVYPAAERGLGGTVAEFVSAAADTARENGHHLVLWPFRTNQADEVRDLVLQGMADGVLVMEVTLDDPRVATLRDAGVPFTMIGRTRDVGGLPSVDVDFERTTREAVDHLVGLGHRRIAFLNHSEATATEGYAPTFRAEEGFAAAMRSHGLEPLTRRVDESPQAGREALADVLADQPGTTALVTMNEIATFGVLAELQHRGVGVPEQMSVLAIVTSPGVADMSNPPLTTMHAPGAELGRLAVLNLLSQVSGEGSPAAGALIGCTLEPGQSVGPARDAAPASGAAQSPPRP
ncbi:LacI family DNA-binding transcriptional regulator [Isoptericola hypogeus]|uniref:LacI family DNA-binding transcriptional regulator n=1 Tax=Isoptericola hypogeus TaxID=300179 RepID=A0ABN2IPZ0_9MICO